MKQIEKIDINFEIKEIELTKDNIGLFKPIDNIRSIRKTQVAKLESAFSGDEYLETTLIHVNERDGEFRVIDGNHRIIAIRNLIEADKIEKAKVGLAIYKNLSDKEERGIYDLIAKQVPQSTNDFLSLHKSEFPIWNIITSKSFPCKVTIYGAKDSLQLKTMLYMLRLMNRKKIEPSSSYISRETLLSIGMKTNIDDYNILARFIKIFMATFGIPGIENKFNKIHIITPMFNIWYLNKDMYADKVVGNLQQDLYWVKRLEMLIGDPEITMHLNTNCTRETIPDIRARMIKVMQFRGYAKHKLI